MTPQQSIAHYRIVSKLGEGGMGAVYRATDTKLNRDVAIKVLPEAFAQDASRMARFEREAQVLASLNHPNIAAIYGLEQGAIVMELVEGADLAGPVPIDTAIGYAKQIVAGLEAAHERGIVHRDLKPANIKVTPEGTVKLLDFGLAKAAEQNSAASSAAAATMSPTLSLSMTQAGMILGTAAYMSPEQARGMPVDRRADIWAFGVIFYEMLTGSMLFGDGETVSDTLAAVLTRAPDFSALPKDTPPRVRRLIERCLHNDPKLRLRDIGEARILLDEAEVAQASAGEPGPAPPAAPHSRWWMGAAAALGLALAALSAIHFREMPPEREAVRFQVPAPEGGVFVRPYMSLSPDGRSLAFNAAGKGGQPLLWVRTLNSLEARALPGTEGATMHFWSPDSRFLGFWASGKLKKIEASGGPPQVLCSAATSTAVAGWWTPEGVIFFSNGTEGIFRVPQAGGNPVQVTKPDISHGESSYWYPQILPDGRHFLYLIVSLTAENDAIYLGSLDGKEKKRLLGASNSFSYMPPSGNGKSGHLLFLREDTLMAQPLDAKTFDLSGDAFPVAEHVGRRLSYAFFTVSPSGALAWGTGGAASGDRQLTWFDRAGKPLATLGTPADINSMALSRDGTRAAVVESQVSNRDIWLFDVARGIRTRFTFDEAFDTDPVWSPDGSRVAFSSAHDGPFTLYMRDSSGAAKEERLQKAEAGGERPCDWSSDGRYLMYVRSVAASNQLWFLSEPMGDPARRKSAPYLETPFNTLQCQFSPGAGEAPRWVAYSSGESKQGYEVYVQSFPAGAGKFQISNGGGSQPRWRRDGKELFYIAPDGKLMAVDVKTSLSGQGVPRFESGIPHALFDSRMRNPGGLFSFHYDVTPDGQRFLVDSARQAEAAAAPEAITVVTNWMAGSKK